jgi:hypothetical protein
VALVVPLLAEAERRGAERGWQDALDIAGDESHDLRINLCGETDWSKVENLLWSHLEEIAGANPYREPSSADLGAQEPVEVAGEGHAAQGGAE